MAGIGGGHWCSLIFHSHRGFSPVIGATQAAVSTAFTQITKENRSNGSSYLKPVLTTGLNAAVAAAKFFFLFQTEPSDDSRSQT